MTCLRQADFCAEHGYEEDSRKAEKVWKQYQRTAQLPPRVLRRGGALT